MPDQKPEQQKCPCCTGPVVMVAESVSANGTARFTTDRKATGPQCPCCQGPVILLPGSVQADGTAKFTADPNPPPPVANAPATPLGNVNWNGIATWGTRLVTLVIISILGKYGITMKEDIAKDIATQTNVVATQNVENNKKIEAQIQKLESTIKMEPQLLKPKPQDSSKSPP